MRHWSYPLRLLCALCCFASGVAGQSARDEPFIPAGATVVLFPSLAGDLESERTFNSQVEALAEVVGKTAATKLVIFSESASTVQLPPRINVEQIKPSAAAFVNSAARLATTNPIVVIVWGHGGTQGQAPVFHVRGPRLMAADFKQFAENTAKGPSTWVLMFRGSSRFASELASAQRQIISSEHDSMFRSDPIGMSILVKLLRDNPTATFGAIADRLGPAVAKWYDDQNLARTEEPTVWVGSGPPQPLIAAAQPLEKIPTANAKESQTSPPGPATKNNPDGWSVTRVKASDYPDADSIILKRRITYTLGVNPAIAAEHEEYIQVLTSEGKEAGDFDITYSPPYERLEFLDCEIQRPDGSLLRLDPDDIREADAASEPAAEARSRRKFFSMPDVTPGAIIHVRFTREWQKFPLPHVTLKLPLAEDAPAIETMLRVSVPRETPFHFRLEQVKGNDPEVKQTDYSSTYTWQFRDIPAWEEEPLTLPDSGPALLVSTFPDWKTFADWYARIVRLADQPTSEITNKAVELTQHCKSRAEKVAALYNYVTGLRYVAVPLGVNSFRPHAAAGVLRNQYGDCKDKANLFNALLRSQGIQADLVLVPRFGQAYDDLPGFAFNHAISRVDSGPEALWFDTTDDICRFGMLPPGDAGRRVLVIDGKTAALTELPRPRATDHVLEIITMIDTSNLRSDASTKITATTHGYADYSLRAAARTTGKRKSVPLLNNEFALANGLFALKNQTFTSPSDLDRDFALNMDGALIGICERQGSDAALRNAFWIPTEWMVASHERDQPLFLNDGYPLLLKQRVEMKVPFDVSPPRLPPEQHSKNGPLHWSLVWSHSPEKGVVVARLDCELLRPELPREETGQFQKQVRELFAALARTATFSIPNLNKE